MTCGYELIDIYITGDGLTTHALPHYFAVAMEKSKKEVFHLLIVSLFPRNSGITAKNGWYNKVTMTTMDTMTTLNTSMLLFSKQAARFSEIPTYYTEGQISRCQRKIVNFKPNQQNWSPSPSDRAIPGRLVQDTPYNIRGRFYRLHLMDNLGSP